MSDTPASTSKQDTPSGCAVRFFWMLVGNMALFFIAMSIVQHDPFGLSWRDGAFAGVVFALIIARFVDIAYLDGRTAKDEPASRSDWTRYATRLVLGSVAVWLAAHGLATFGWTQ